MNNHLNNPNFQKPKGYFPEGSISESSGLWRFMGCVTILIVFFIIIVALNMPL